MEEEKPTERALRALSEEQVNQFFQSPILAYLRELWEDMHTTWTNTLKNLGTEHSLMNQAQGALVILDHDIMVEQVVRGKISELRQSPPEPPEDKDEEDDDLE